VTIDLAGDKSVAVRVERQDLDEMLGNLVENAAKYGGGRVFVTVEPAENGFAEILIEDDGPGIALAKRDQLFTRGARLDTTGKEGTGLGLAIVRDVAEIYGGTVTLTKAKTSAACSPGCGSRRGSAPHCFRSGGRSAKGRSNDCNDPLHR
jgi:signal transduction histidine kinase